MECIILMSVLTAPSSHQTTTTTGDKQQKENDRMKKGWDEDDFLIRLCRVKNHFADLKRLLLKLNTFVRING